MAKTKKTQAADGLQTPKGPYLGAAFIAERVLTESDGVNSFIRWIDRVGLTHDTVENAKVGEFVAMPLTWVISFRGGEYIGKSVLTIIQLGPSGETFPVGVAETQFDGPRITNINLFAQVMVMWQGAGQYWFDLNLDKKFITRVGLHIEASNVALQNEPLKGV